MFYTIIQHTYSLVLIPSELEGEELKPSEVLVVADEDERASLVTVESDRSVEQLDRHLEVVLELSTENINSNS